MQSKGTVNKIQIQCKCSVMLPLTFPVRSPIALLTVPGRRDPSVSVPSHGFFLAILKCYLKPFETATVIKGLNKYN